LSNANTYTGATTISAGSLQLGNGGTTGALTGTTGITNNANLTINRSDAFTQATDLNGQAITGTGSFTQAGSGTTTLTAANTYSGPTTISAGTLEVNNTTGSGTGSGTVTVNGTLAGQGSITTSAGNYVYINGTFQVGNLGATQGTDFSITAGTGGSTILGAASFTMFDLWSTTGSDQSSTLAAADMLRIFGDFSITSGATLKLNNPNALSFAAGDVFKLFDWAGLTSLTGTYGSNIDATALNLGSLTLDTSNLYSLGTISILGIPEPSRALLLMIGITGLVTRRRRE
jgi:autotransporter-associated beta strand protein